MNRYDLSILKIEDFPEGFRDIVETIGIEAAYKICSIYGGNPIYVPKTDNINKRLRDLSIQQEYKKGATIEQLCQKYNLSFNQIRLICNMANLKQLSIHEFLDKSK